MRGTVREQKLNCPMKSIFQKVPLSIFLWIVGEMHIIITLNALQHWMLPLGTWKSLCSVSPLSVTLHKGMVRNSLSNIAFLPPQHWSENQNPKHNSTYLCTHKSLPSVFSSHLLSLWLSLCWSHSFPFLPFSCDTLFDTQTNFFFVDHITGCSLFPPLHTALSCYSQFAAGGRDMHTYENRTTCRCLGCMPTATFLVHTCTQSLLLKFNAGRNNELLPQVSTEKTIWRCTLEDFVTACNWPSSLVSKRSLVSVIRGHLWLVIK